MTEPALFIEEQAPYPEWLIRFFEATGFSIERTSSSSEARRRIANHRYGLIFFNLPNPAEHGFPLIRELSDNADQLFITGPNDVPLALRALQMGALYYWPTPVQISDVESMFHNGTFSLKSRPPLQREGTLLQIIKEIALTMEMDSLINILMDSAMELAGADVGELFLLDDQSNILVIKAIRGLSGTEIQAEYFGLPETQYYEILKNKETVFLRHPPAVTSNGQAVSAIIAAPIWWKKEPIGLLVVVKFAESGKVFSSDDYKLISLMTQEISGAVYNAITHHKTKELTIKDDLTEAYNRRYFERYLEEELMRARRYGSNVSLIFLDVDNLKEVNARHGHLIGSKTLQEVAHRMILTVRGIDKVVRYGGDEFCVVLPETDTNGAYQVADRIRSTIASSPFKINESLQVNLTGSIGIASFPLHANNKEDLVRQADRAMFVIKNKTKNAIAVAEGSV